MDLQTALTGYQTKQRKVLEPVDHQKIQYEPYRKNFYVEVPELAKMTTEGMLTKYWRILIFCYDSLSNQAARSALQNY